MTLGARSSWFGVDARGGNYRVVDKATSSGEFFFVDSTNAAASDTSGFGGSPEVPLATIDGAVGFASAGDTIIVMPGHVEDLGVAETIDFDKAGLTIVGQGEGTLRPRIDFNAADSAVDVGADNVTLRNLTFRPGITSTLIGVDVEASVVGTVIEGCAFLVGEAAGTDEFVVCIDLKSANHDTIIRNNIFRTDITDASCVAAILMTAASARVIIHDNVMYGNWSTAAIDDGAACTELLIQGNRMKVKDGEPGIELHTNTTGLIIFNHVESTGVTADDAIDADDCGWVENYCVVGDGLTAELIGSKTEVLGAGAIDANTLAADTITDAKIADDAISKEHIDADAAQRMIMGRKVKRAAADVLNGGTVPLFTVAGGMVAIHGIVGITSVATVDASASNTKYSANPTTGTANDLCATADMNAKEIGTMLSLPRMTT